MKTSELHQLIGKPVFLMGDRVRIQETDQVGWVSHICVTHGFKAYWYIIVDQEENYIKGYGLHSGFLAQDIDLDNPS